jgi:folate-binding protein YgfZ
MNTAYQALRESAAWIDLSSRGKIRLTGEDRARLLHAMTTNQIEKLAPGEGCYTFFLNAQGRILADANVLCETDSLLLDTEPELRERLFQHLDQFIIADDVTLEDVTDSLATIAIEGPQAAAVLEKLAAPIPQTEQSWEAWNGRIVLRASTTGSDGWLVFMPVQEKQALIASLEDLPQADAEAVRAVRIENGRPRYGEEITDRFLLQETGQMRAVNFSKGCYLGQEIVERVRSRGQVHRHLLPVQIETPNAPLPGTKLTADGKELAEIMSAAFAPALNKVAALAYVRTDAARPGFELFLGDTRAVVGAARTTSK